MTHTNRTIFSLLALSLLIATPAVAQDDEAKENSSPPWSMADQYWGADKMAKSRRAVQAANGAQTNYFVMADRFEWQASENEDTLLWDGQGWYGGDINKLWIKTEGEVSLADDGVEEAEVQALWSRAISPFWDLQAGVRQDFEPDGRTHGVIGVQGLAPYWFEVDAAAFVSTEGDVTARIEVEYDLLLTQRLILQPRAELELSVQDIPELELGSGLTGLDAGLRLRYEIKREFAPYIGIEWQSAFGETADLIEAAGGDADKTVFILGLRAWF